ncbi:MAG: protein kinase [Holophagales bacterium]|nr:protein kinase [Holophagales bacterium]
MAGVGALALSVAGALPSTQIAGDSTNVFAALHALALAAAALLLRLAGWRDVRARVLAAGFAAAGSSFVVSFLARAGEGASPSVGSALHLLRALSVDALLPYFLWRFVTLFPEALASPRARALLAAVERVALASGVALGAAKTWNVATGLRTGLLERFAGGTDNYATLYYPIVALLVLPVFPAMIWRARRAPRTERRRVALFTAGLAVGLVPATVYLIFYAVVPGMGARDPSVGLGLFRLLVKGTLLLVPFLTAYSVLVHKALDIRLVVRRALQYLLARWTLAAAAVTPFVLLVAYVWERQDATVKELFSGVRPLGLLATAAIGTALLTSRHRVLDGLDRRFFRERWDAQTILSQLAARSRAAGTPPELAALLTTEIDRALHLDAVTVFALDPETSKLVAPDGSARPLDSTSALAGLLGSSSEALSVELERGSGPASRLPEDDRVWIADGGFRLLVPMVASDGLLVGLIALGEKRSELPIQDEDRKLLSAIAASGSLALENRLLRFTSSHPPARTPTPGPALLATPYLLSAESSAAECPACATLHPSRETRCPHDGSVLVPAPVPFVLAGKYRFEKRLGAGGMGVVYRALDLALARPVAVKALPRVSPEAALRLRREARAVAAVTHPNLALIYAADSWHGTPLLVFELLEEATLADRIRKGRLAPAEVVRIGVAIASALEAIHAAGILHRDVKPSNIGFSKGGEVKLLDFGLARVDLDRRGEGALGPSASPLVPTPDAVTPLMGDTRTDCIVGTPGYISPEAVVGGPPDPSFDLWGLSMVLYHAATGTNPLAGGTPLQILQRSRHPVIPDPCVLVPELPPALGSVLARCLAREQRRRPGSAAEMRALLAASGALFA